MFVTLPSNSSITYEVEISNKSDINSFVKSISRESNTNTNVDINISISLYDVIDNNSSKTFVITISNNTSLEQEEVLVYKYEFVKDSTAPTLTLTKETYIEDDFSGWTLVNAYVNSDGVLVLGEDGNFFSASVEYLDVNCGKWYPIFDAYTENASDVYSTRGGLYWNTYYFDYNYNSTTTNDGFSMNGWAVSLSLGIWNNGINWYKRNGVTMEIDQRYGPNVKYVKLIFSLNNSGLKYTNPPVMVRNFKIYGESIPNSFYYINIVSSDNEGVITTKYAKGEMTQEYFMTDGINVENNQIKVTENGIYTVFVEDIVGNSTIKTIEITNIQ